MCPTEVPREKVADYLLSPTHPRGRDKEAFFVLFGFRLEAWEELAAALREHAGRYEVASSTRTRYGTRYAVEGPLRTPSGRMPWVRSAWFIDEGATIPRLVSAYPLAGGEP
ncbi:MAG: DUF6883 domain-containing protein [Dehalococcoidia bacterium]